MEHMNRPPVGNEGLLLSYTYMGTFLFCFGLWNWIQSLRLCYSLIKENKSGYTASATHGFGCCKVQFYEALTRLLMSVLGLVIEGVTLSYGRNREYAHFPFYSATLLAAVMDIFIAIMITPPEGMDYVAHALPFFVQTYCLRAQSYGQPHITETCRLLISYSAFCAGLAIFTEMLMKNSLIWTWLKCFTITLKGTWLWQTAHILNPLSGKPWEETDHGNIMYVSMAFVWHMFFVVILQLAMLLLVAKCYHVSSDWTINDKDKTVTTNNINLSSTITSNHRTRSEHRDRDEIEYVKLLNDDS